jgi:Bacterial PH domain
MSAPQQSGQAAKPGQPTAPGQPGKPDVYRSVPALVVWWVWVVFAAANLVDLAVQGHNHFAAMIAVILVLITGITFISAFRPRVVASDEHLMIKNPMREHRVPWGCVESLVLRDSLEIHCGWEDGSPRNRKLYAWAVHSPRRTRVKAEMRARRKINMENRQLTAFDKLPPEAKAAASRTNEEQIVDSLNARAAKAKTASAEHQNTGGPVSRWDRLAFAAVLIPAALVIIVVLT